MTNHYIIGDLQGCHRAFNNLLTKIEFDEKCDHITLCGDIVARGDDSLATLRQVKTLSDKGVLSTVLGNHDITLIANWLGVFAPKKKDGTACILQANDCDELLEWLRRQPFLINVGDVAVVTHAGIPHIWSDSAAQDFACIAHNFFAGSKAYLQAHLADLYDKPTQKAYKATNTHIDELRLIVNYFTRMRLIDEKGVLEFEFKQNPHNPANKLPANFYPWYLFDSQQTRRVYFGHWAALCADVADKKVQSLDGGAVWGGRLVAYRLNDHKMFYVKNIID